jgi:hypothetical protein
MNIDILFNTGVVFATIKVRRRRQNGKKKIINADCRFPKRMLKKLLLILGMSCKR